MSGIWATANVCNGVRPSHSEAAQHSSHTTDIKRKWGYLDFRMSAFSSNKTQTMLACTLYITDHSGNCLLLLWQKWYKQCLDILFSWTACVSSALKEEFSVGYLRRWKAVWGCPLILWLLHLWIIYFFSYTRCRCVTNSGWNLMEKEKDLWGVAVAALQNSCVLVYPFFPKQL